jgi:hypothetical protein
MNEIETNDKFDKLTNLDISTHYRDIDIWALPSEFLGAFAYWVVVQNPNKGLIDIHPALMAFNFYVLSFFDDPALPEKFNYERLNKMIDEDVFASIPEILTLNELKPDFIDLGALARNMFYMILREHITQDS